MTSTATRSPTLVWAGALAFGGASFLLACTAALGIDEAHRERTEAVAPPSPATDVTVEPADAASAAACPSCPVKLLSRLPRVLTMTASDTHLVMRIQGAGHLLCDLPSCTNPRYLSTAGSHPAFSVALSERHFAYSFYPLSTAGTASPQPPIRPRTTYCEVERCDVSRSMEGILAAPHPRGFFVVPPTATGVAAPPPPPVVEIVEGVPNAEALPLDLGSPIARVGEWIYARRPSGNVEACRIVGTPSALACEPSAFPAGVTPVMVNAKVAVFADPTTQRLATCELPACKVALTTMPLREIDSYAASEKRLYGIARSKSQVLWTSRDGAAEPRVAIEGARDIEIAASKTSLFVAHDGVLERIDEAP